MHYLLTADYHTHTRYSHGKGTIEQNVQVARAKGLKKIALIRHPPHYYRYKACHLI